jgi:hypothetical protein
MADDRVRTLGSVEDIDGQGLSVGVDYDTVSLGLAEFGRTWRFTRAQAEEFAQLFIAACWEAADQGGRMAAEDSDGDDDGPVFITMNADPPKPPYGTPERAVWDAGHA